MFLSLYHHAMELQTGNQWIVDYEHLTLVLRTVSVWLEINRPWNDSTFEQSNTLNWSGILTEQWIQRLQWTMHLTSDLRIASSLFWLFDGYFTSQETLFQYWFNPGKCTDITETNVDLYVKHHLKQCCKDIGIQIYMEIWYSKTYVNWLLSKIQKIVFQDQLSLNAGQKYCKMLPKYLWPSLSYNLSFGTLFVYFWVAVLHRIYCGIHVCKFDLYRISEQWAPEPSLQEWI